MTNAGWVDGGSTDGLRRCLADEFANIHVFHLRGRRGRKTSGERAKQEGGQVFGSGSAVPVAITLLVKNSAATEQGCIAFHDIGNYLSRERKLAAISRFGSINGITEVSGWASIHPDVHGDWLRKRDARYEKYILTSDKKAREPTLFVTHTRGVQTTRDAWCINPSPTELWRHVSRAAQTYNARAALRDDSGSEHTEFSWCQKTRSAAKAGRSYVPDENRVVIADVRPFTRAWLYTDNFLNWSAYKVPEVFPIGGPGNYAIGVPSRGFSGSFSVLKVRHTPVLHHTSLEGSEFFPLWLFKPKDAKTAGELPLERHGPNLVEQDGITDFGLSQFRAAYPGQPITKNDLFHYVYGLLHSPDYRDRYADNLSKELPRIPAVKGYDDFQAFVDAGRRLGDLHCDYDEVVPFPATIAQGALELAHIPDPVSFYRVEKMRFGAKRPNVDKTTIIYNSNITLTGIPIEAYDYLVNGKPAIEWVMERQCVKTDKASGIVWDANAFANETMDDPAYPLKLLLRVITVSLETMKIVRSLPKLEIQTP